MPALSHGHLGICAPSISAAKHRTSIALNSNPVLGTAAGIATCCLQRCLLTLQLLLLTLLCRAWALGPGATRCGLLGAAASFSEWGEAVWGKQQGHGREGCRVSWSKGGILGQQVAHDTLMVAPLLPLSGRGMGLAAASFEAVGTSPFA